MGLFSNLNLGNGIATVVNSIFGGAANVITATGQSGILDSEAAVAATQGIVASQTGIPPSALGGSGSNNQDDPKNPKDDKLLDVIKKEESSPWPWIIGGIILVTGIVIAWLSFRSKGGTK